MTFFQEDDRIFHLKCGNELQLIVMEKDDKVWIKLIEGSAEIFGSNLVLNKEYEFSYFSSISVFSWTGCIIKLRERASRNTRFRIKTSRQIPKMIHVHEQIEEIRMLAHEKNTDFPVILVVGPTDVGKSTLCRFLLNYGVKCGRQPIFVDLDVGQSSLSVTGTFDILPIYEQSDVNGIFKEQELTVYYFGYKSPGHNMKLYKLLLQKVGKSLKVRLKQSQTRSSGVIIDTCGWVDQGGYKLIREIIEMLEVNIVLVLSQASLYSKLANDVSKKTRLIFVKKFEDVIIRNRSVRIGNRNNSVHQYFYGLYDKLTPFTLNISFKDLQIYKADKSHSSNIISVLIEPSILYQVLALSYSKKEEDILSESIYGFISIMELDMDSKIATVLSPQPGPLPTNYLVMGDITLIH